MRKISSKANTNETAESCKGIIELSKRYVIADDAYYTVTVDKLTERTENLFRKINAGWLNNELKEKDELRDIDVRALFYEVEAKCMRRPNASQEKAMKVKVILNRYGMKIVGGSYTNESAQIRAMLSDLNAPELAKDIRAVLELKQLMMNLEGSQADFDVASAELIEDKFERENTKPASVIAKELKDIINQELVSYLGAMTLAQPDKFKAYTDVLNTLIEENNRKVRDRIAAQKKKRAEAEIN